MVVMMRSLVNIAAAETGLSLVLLNRARAVADEHATLSAKLDVSFNVKAAKRIAELVPVANALKEWDKANEVCCVCDFRALSQ